MAKKIGLDDYVGRVDLIRLTGERTHAQRGVTDRTYCGRGYLFNKVDQSHGTTKLRGITCPDCRRMLKAELENPEEWE